MLNDYKLIMYSVRVEICAVHIPLRVHYPYGNNWKELFLIMQSLRFH